MSRDEENHRSEEDDRLRSRAERHLLESHGDVATMPVEDVIRLVHELEIHQIELEMQNDQLRETQFALEVSRDEYVDLYDFAPVGYMTVDSKGVISEANLTVARMLGIERSKVIGLHVQRLVVRTDRDRIHCLLRDVFAERTKQVGEVQLIGDADKTLHVRLEAIAREDLDGDGNSCRIAIIDITERMRVEEELRHDQKTKAIGQLAGGVAHEFNNLLATILGFTELLLIPNQDEDGWLGEKAETDLGRIQSAALRAAELTKQLLTFARKEVRKLEILNLPEVVGRSADIFERLLPENITFRVDAAPGLRPILADPGQIEQVVTNLVINARDAMPEGGELTVECSSVGPHTVLAVSDTGGGISGEAREHLFEPFFTTKPVGQGTGLGLAMVYGIVVQTGGHITVETELGKGSTFKVYFPAAAERALKVSKDASAESFRGGEVILWCEDEAGVRDATAAALTAAGYTVLTTEHGQQALEVAEEWGKPIDLLLTDVIMPVMDGRKLAQEMALRHPEVRTIFVSGYSDGVLGEQAAANSRTEFLQKPVRLKHLLQRIRRLLDANPAIDTTE